MCHVPSWITTKDAVLFLTDKDAQTHGIDWKDATGHSAIRKLYPNVQGEQGEGLGKHTPKEVISALATGKMNRIAAAGELSIVDGKWTLPLTKIDGSVYVREGATLTVPALTKIGGSVYVQQGATLTAPALTTIDGSVDVQQGATLTAPKLRRGV